MMMKGCLGKEVSFTTGSYLVGLLLLLNLDNQLDLQFSTRSVLVRELTDIRQNMTCSFDQTVYVHAYQVRYR